LTEISKNCTIETEDGRLIGPFSHNLVMKKFFFII